MGNRVGNKAAPNAARVAPNRRWFGNTRVIGQEELDRFRDAMTEKVCWTSAHTRAHVHVPVPVRLWRHSNATRVAFSPRLPTLTQSCCVNASCQWHCCKTLPKHGA